MAHIEQNEHGEDVRVTVTPGGSIIRELVRPPLVEPEDRRITLGALQKRIGPMKVFAIDTSAHPVCVALRSYLSRLTYADLDDPDMAPMLGMLVAAGQPAANPVFPGSGPLTESDVAEIIGAQVQPKERP